jgi:hypothetical protein
LARIQVQWCYLALFNMAPTRSCPARSINDQQLAPIPHRTCSDFIHLTHICEDLKVLVQEQEDNVQEQDLSLGKLVDLVLILLPSDHREHVLRKFGFGNIMERRL